MLSTYTFKISTNFAHLLMTNTLKMSMDFAQLLVTYSCRANLLVSCTFRAGVDFVKL